MKTLESFIFMFHTDYHPKVLQLHISLKKNVSLQTNARLLDV